MTAPEPVYDEDGLTLYQADVLDGLAALDDESVQMCVTSPPYWGLRDYGTAQWTGGDGECDHARFLGGNGAASVKQVSSSGTQAYQYRDSCGKCGAERQDKGLGLEPTPELYVERLVAVFREVRRVLRDDGTLWLNLGDSYISTPTGNPLAGSTLQGGKATQIEGAKRPNKVAAGMKPKDLVGIPWMVAFALRADGWYLRSDIVWAKPNPMPESVTDRPTKSHEYVFLLSKSQRYYFDQDAVREPVARVWDAANGGSWAHTENQPNGSKAGHHSGDYPLPNPLGRNIRTVWYIATQPSPLPHFAAFPDALVEPCIKAGCPPKVCPACGEPWQRWVEKGEPILQAWSAKGAGQYDDSTGAMRRTSIAEGSTLKHTVPRTTIDWLPGCHCPEDADVETVQPVPGVVLDPFCGTGTTLKVARGLGRKAVGIELSEKYCELAVQRLRYGVKGVQAIAAGQEPLL